MSDYGIMYRKKESRVVLNLISLLWLAISVLIFLWGFTFVDENVLLAVKCLGAMSMGIAGLVMTKITVGIHWKREITSQDLQQTLFLTSLACFGVLIINVVTMKYATRFESTPMPRSLFSVLLGTMEEVVVRAFLQTWLWVLTGSVLLAVIGSSVVFATFHGSIYGLEPTAIFIVFSASVMLGYVYQVSGRQLHITQTSHGIVNLLSYMGGK